MQDEWFIVRYPSRAAHEGEVLTRHQYPTQTECQKMCDQLARKDRRAIFEPTQLGKDNNVYYTLEIPIVQPSTSSIH